MLARLALLATSAVLLSAATAHARTFCVGAPSGCTGVAVPAAKLQADALHSSLLQNGQPDEIVLGPGTYVTPKFFTLGAGSDPVVLRGAGAGATVLTSSSTSDGSIMDLKITSHPVTIRDLAFEVPATFVDGFVTAGLRVNDAVLEDVRVTSHNPRTNGIEATGTTTLRRVVVRAPLGEALLTGWPHGDLTVEDSDLGGAYGLYVHQGQQPSSVEVSRSVLAATAGAVKGAAVQADRGAVQLRSSLLTVQTNGATEVVGINASAGAVVGEHVTIARSGGPLEGTVGLWSYQGGGGDTTLISLRNAIISGVAVTGRRTGPAAPTDGAAKIAVTGSVLPTAVAAGTGGGSVTQAGNVIGDPKFLPGGFRLAAGSPAIDSAMAGATGLDLDRLARVADGDGDGSAIADRGAYERPAPVPPTEGAASAPGAPVADVPAPAVPVAAPAAPVRAAVVGAAPVRRCVVPKLKGRTPAAARKALRGAGCRTGRVTGAKKGRLRVKRQSVAARRSVAAGTKVALVLERARRR